MFLTLLCTPTEYEAVSVGIGKVDMEYGGKMVGVKRAPTSCYYIVGILDWYVILNSICFIIIIQIIKSLGYWLKIYAYIMII